MRRTCLLAAFLVGLVGLVGSPALAGTAHHTLRKEGIKPLKRGGEVIGAKIPVVLHPGTGSSGTPTRVFVALGAATKQGFTSNGYPTVCDKKAGYLRHQFEWTELAGVAGALELELKLEYGKGNNLKAGDTVDLYTMWQIPGGNWHLWGSVMFYEGSADVIKLPE